MDALKRLKTFLLSPWLPVAVVVLLLLRLVVSDLLVVFRPITVLWPQLPVPVLVTFMLIPLVIAAIMSAVDLWMRRWRWLLRRLLLLSVGVGISFGGSHLRRWCSEGLRYRSKVTVELTDDDHLVVDGRMMDEDGIRDFARRLYMRGIFNDNIIVNVYGGYAVEEGVRWSVSVNPERSVRELFDRLLSRCIYCDNCFLIEDENGPIPFAVPSRTCCCMVDGWYVDTNQYMRVDICPESETLQCRTGGFEALMNVFDEESGPGGKPVDVESALSDAMVRDTKGFVCLCVDGGCTVRQFRRVLRRLYDRGYRTIWVFHV